jgi:hypothetical protein
VLFELLAYTRYRIKFIHKNNIIAALYPHKPGIKKNSRVIKINLILLKTRFMILVIIKGSGQIKGRFRAEGKTICQSGSLKFEIMRIF